MLPDMDTDPDLCAHLGYRQTVDDCRADRIGAGGLTISTLETLLRRLSPAIERLQDAHASGQIPFLRLPSARADLEALEPYAEHYQRRFDDVLILGTGGSSLGSRALYEMADREADRLRRAPQLHIITNVDPFVWDRLIRRLDYRKTGIVVISKSGGTTETMMQFLSLLPVVMEQLDAEDLRRHVTLITEPGDNPLRRLGARYRIPVLDHDPKVGGRYSVLSVVGMLPTMIAGLDAVETREGAQRVLDQAFAAKDNPAACPAAVGAAVSVGLQMERSIAATVMLAYSDRLGSLARWYRQLWAESLGKNGLGTTPVYATGPVDQHSQLQLWLDGPADKMFTVMGGPNDMSGAAIDPALAEDPRLSYLVGRSMGDLMDASRRATAETLARRGRPVRRIELARIDEGAMGALMMHFMLETVLAADLMGVDPFDQPAVEDGKVLIRRYLAERGDAS
ncbi:glucose-6-phosphate isomerase [Pacificispira sp.]|uniref:glucose-6-phosphate isomerase n=1 Tax=Pacificispira sp. TaxID=2888761 RepID=UPI003BA9ACC2